MWPASCRLRRPHLGDSGVGVRHEYKSSTFELTWSAPLAVCSESLEYIVQNPCSNSVLPFLADRYPFLISIRQLSTILGVSEQSIRNQLLTDTFPIPSTKRGRLRRFRLQDVAAFLDQPSGHDVFRVASVPRRGRPTKVEQAARQRAADNGQ